jgi:hypothetical protein
VRLLHPWSYGMTRTKAAGGGSTRRSTGVPPHVRMREAHVPFHGVNEGAPTRSLNITREGQSAEMVGSAMTNSRDTGNWGEQIIGAKALRIAKRKLRRRFVELSAVLRYGMMARRPSSALQKGNYGLSSHKPSFACRREQIQQEHRTTGQSATMNTKGARA